MNDFRIKWAYMKYRRKGKRVFRRIVSEPAFYIIYPSGKRYNKYVERCGKDENWENTIFIQGAKKGWQFPHRIRWAAKAVSHEQLHITLDLSGEHEAARAIDNPRVELLLWEYC